MANANFNRANNISTSEHVVSVAPFGRVLRLVVEPADGTREGPRAAIAAPEVMPGDAHFPEFSFLELRLGKGRESLRNSTSIVSHRRNQASVLPFREP